MTSDNSLFSKSNYIPFMIGVFVFGGLLVLPGLYGEMVNLDYNESLPWSLGSCVVFLIAFRRDGSISWWRAALAIVLFLIVANVYHRSTGRPAFQTGGALGFILVMICGYAGILVALPFTLLFADKANTAHAIGRNDIVKSHRTSTTSDRDKSQELATLHVAARDGDLQTVQLLLLRDVDINRANTDMWTPLHFAAPHNHVDIVRALLDAGADTTLVDRYERTSLDVARDEGHSEIVALLSSS